MNSHNGRAEEAATLADTMGRQKHGCSLAWRPSQSVSGNKREREKEAMLREREREWMGRERMSANEPALFARRSATLSRRPFSARQGR